MMPRRGSAFKLSWLMALVAILGIELAALRSQSYLGDTLAFNVAAAVLILACFAARFGPKDSRDFWFGFAVLGWSQFVLGILLVVINYSRDAGKLPTNRITIELVNWAIPVTIAVNNPIDNQRFNSLEEIMTSRISHNIIFLYHKANAIVSIGVAVVGGVLAQVLGSRIERRKRPHDSGPERLVEVPGSG